MIPQSTDIKPYDIRLSQTLEGIYHKGQNKAWNGKEVLDELINRHNGISLSKDKIESIQNIFSIILLGEYAAWNVSSELAVSIDHLEAKMAATSQAHDEARHFYVMQDYFKHLGCSPNPLPKNVAKVIKAVSETDNFAKKLLGMQLMIEPIALTVFKFVIKSEVEPVLCEMLRLYEKDEARHVAFGIKYLVFGIWELQRGN